jgi:hypothetical protein
MARQWPVGNVLETPLDRIVQSNALKEVRTTIHDTVWVPKLSASRSADGHAAEGEPDEDDERPYPDEGEPTPAECPQLCIPDTVTPKCPQRCDPHPVTCDPIEPQPEDEPDYTQPTPEE